MRKAGYVFIRGRRFGITVFKESKFSFFGYIFLVVIGVLTGVFTAIKSGGIMYFGLFTDFTLVQFSSTSVIEFGTFFSRFFSVTVIICILSVFSVTVFLVPFGCVVVAYRSYLVGLNISLMTMMFGFSGAVQSIFVILPMQLLMLGIFGIYFIMFAKLCNFSRRYGRGSGRLKLFFVCWLLLIVLVAAETLLLALFSSNVILVI